jgi:phosphoribosyl 1,2-cyclic phosphodiesterase
VAAEIDGDRHIVLDCGSGLRLLGNALLRRGPGAGRHFHVFFSHYHIDHLAGLPFFQPLYDPLSTVTFYGFEPRGRSLRETLETLLSPPYFPVSLGAVPARVDYVTLNGDSVLLGDVRVGSLPLRHPDGSLCYRLDHGAHRIVYATDHEHGDEKTDEALVSFSEGADYLIHDATYLRAEYESLRRGWGHSTWYAAVRTARAARVGKLVLFHHHPEHTDDDLEEILKVTRAELPTAELAREGLELPF